MVSAKRCPPDPRGFVVVVFAWSVFTKSVSSARHECLPRPKWCSRVRLSMNLRFSRLVPLSICGSSCVRFLVRCAARGPCFSLSRRRQKCAFVKSLRELLGLRPESSSSKLCSRQELARYLQFPRLVLCVPCGRILVRIAADCRSTL